MICLPESDLEMLGFEPPTASGETVLGSSSVRLSPNLRYQPSISSSCSARKRTRVFHLSCHGDHYNSHPSVIMIPIRVLLDCGRGRNEKKKKGS
jgi:hypothetical protein